jgi:hypothetical protein
VNNTKYSIFSRGFCCKTHTGEERDVSIRPYRSQAWKFNIFERIARWSLWEDVLPCAVQRQSWLKEPRNALFDQQGSVYFERYFLKMWHEQTVIYLSCTEWSVICLKIFSPRRLMMIATVIYVKEILWSLVLECFYMRKNLWISNLTSISFSHMNGVHFSHLSHMNTQINTVSEALNVKSYRIVHSLCTFVISFLKKFHVYNSYS